MRHLTVQFIFLILFIVSCTLLNCASSSSLCFLGFASTQSNFRFFLFESLCETELSVLSLKLAFSDLLWGVLLNNVGDMFSFWTFKHFWGVCLDFRALWVKASPSPLELVESNRAFILIDSLYYFECGISRSNCISGKKLKIYFIPL